LIEVAVDSIRVHMPTGQHVVILKEKNADRYLPIWIGPFEANAIALKITGVKPDRPITHDATELNASLPEKFFVRRGPEVALPARETGARQMISRGGFVRKLFYYLFGLGDLVVSVTGIGDQSDCIRIHRILFQDRQRLPPGVSRLVERHQSQRELGSRGNIFGLNLPHLQQKRQGLQRCTLLRPDEAKLLKCVDVLPIYLSEV